jgi:peptidyl-Lys metalloendopeptidase
LTVKNSSPEVGIEGGLNKRATFNSCSQDQQDKLNSAAASAANLADNAYAQTTAVSSNTYWYNRWFGAYDESRVSIVRNVFESIANRDFTTFTYDCSCTRTDYFTIIGQYIF